VQGNFCKVLDIKPGTTVVEQDIILEAASSLPVHIQDAEGRPLHGTRVTGVGSQNWHQALTCETDTCSVYNLEADKQRLMVFFHPARRIVGTLAVNVGQREPAVVHLKPFGPISGRLAGDGGKPIAGAIIDLHYQDRVAQEIHNLVYEAKQV